MSARRDAERERFLFLLSGLRELDAIAAARRPAALTDFQARWKYTLLAYDEAGMRELGAIAAGAARSSWAESVQQYRARFMRTFERSAPVRGHVNALLHAFGHLSDRLSPEQRTQFLRHLADVRAGDVTPGSARALLRSWADPSFEPWLAAQTYLAAPEARTTRRPHARPYRHRRDPRCVPCPAPAGGPRDRAAD